MLADVDGNLLQADADALVNTVNTVGVMGKGIALQFRKAYPEMFKAYEKACKDDAVSLGRMHVWETGMLDGPRFIINFPTKGHWRAQSHLDDIKTGLTDLVRVIRDRGITSIAVPPLGCGNGGLDWADVRPLIVDAFADLAEVDVRLYPPADAPAAAEMRNATKAPNMTVGRAALVTLLDGYSRVALDASLIEVQKLMYFLQLEGQPLKLNYVKNLYGPYADNLRHVLSHIDGHFISGYGDGNTPVREAEPIHVLPGAVQQAQAVLAEHPDTLARIDRVYDIIDGFESMYSLELLATVHWVMTHDDAAAKDPAAAFDQVRTWNNRKARMFTSDHVTTAWTALRDREVVSVTD